MVFWERPGTEVIPRLRATTPARQERLYNPDAGKSFEDFSRRFAGTDQRLDSLVHHLSLSSDGLTYPTTYSFADTLTLSCSPAQKGNTVRYTLDGSLPTTASPACTEPITLTGTTTVSLQVFDPQGTPAGFPRVVKYTCSPVTGSADGVEAASLGDKNKHGSLTWKNRFMDPITVSLNTPVKNGTIRFTLDGTTPNGTSPKYSQPITLTKTSTVTAQLFDEAGKPKGEPWKKEYIRREFFKNRTTGKITTADKGLSSSFKAADGVVDIEEYWGCDPYPAWWQVDLGSVSPIAAIEVFPYWDGSRYYQYTIDVSTDENNWKQVVDYSTNTAIASPNGVRHTFNPVDARFIRVNMLKNSANVGVHLVEVRAYSPEELR